jgi:hypothetical protein
MSDGDGDEPTSGTYLANPPILWYESPTIRSERGATSRNRTLDSTDLRHTAVASTSLRIVD